MQNDYKDRIHNRDTSVEKDGQVDRQEMLWLSLVERLQREEAPSVSPEFRERVKRAITEERRAQTKKIVRWPAIGGSIAAAALVAWLVIPGLFERSSVAPRDMSPVNEITETFRARTETMLRQAPYEVDSSEALEMAPEMAPEAIAPLEDPDSPSTEASPELPRPEEVVLDDAEDKAEARDNVQLTADVESPPDVHDEDAGVLGADELYVKADDVYLLRMVSEDALEGLARFGFGVFRDTPHGQIAVRQFLRQVRPEERDAVELFLADAFNRGFAVTIQSLE